MQTDDCKSSKNHSDEMLHSLTLRRASDTKCMPLAAAVTAITMSLKKSHSHLGGPRSLPRNTRGTEVRRSERLQRQPCPLHGSLPPFTALLPASVKSIRWGRLGNGPAGRFLSSPAAVTCGTPQMIHLTRTPTKFRGDDLGKSAHTIPPHSAGLGQTAGTALLVLPNKALQLLLCWREPAGLPSSSASLSHLGEPT